MNRRGFLAMLGAAPLAAMVPWKDFSVQATVFLGDGFAYYGNTTSGPVVYWHRQLTRDEINFLYNRGPGLTYEELRRP